MKRSLTAFSLIIAITFTFCKKKETTPEPTPSSTTTTTGGPTSSCSLFNTGYNVYNTNNIITVDSSMIYGMFYDQPNSNTKIFGGTVTVNSLSLTPDQGNFYMLYSPGQVNITSALNWSVTGSGTVTAFSYSYVPSYPKYSGGNLLPDTCVKANGFSIVISGVSNHVSVFNSGVSVNLYQGSNQISKSIQTDSGTITFSAAELAAFNSNATVTLMIGISNINSVSLGGLYRTFNSSYQYNKSIYLK